jgi:hypothetical protein
VRRSISLAQSPNPSPPTVEKAQPPKAATLDSLKTLIGEALAPLEGKISALENKLSSQNKTEDVFEHIKKCPDCYGKLWDTFKSAKYRCANDDCRMPLIQSDEDLAKAEKACLHCGSASYTDRTEE